LRCKLKNNLGATETKYDDLQNQDGDFASEMKYKEKSLALFSMGDETEDILNAIDHYYQVGFDILVFACNRKKRLPKQRFDEFEDRHIVEKFAPNDADKDRAINEIINLLV